MTDDKAIRPCGSSYAYCTGNCSGCAANNTYATNSTEAASMYAKPSEAGDVLYQPSIEDYTFSRKCMKDLSSWINLSKNRQNSLLDDLCKEREMEKGWKELYDGHKEIVRKYEILQELSGEHQDD